jgi:hypothetical protein
MKILTSILMFSLGLVPFLSGQAVAQSGEAPRLVPVEMFLCNYNKGKGPKDMQRVNDKWNEWMDEVGETGYTAWNLTPMFFGSGVDFDVAWLGAWADGKRMGESNQRWVTEGRDQQAMFDKVVSCDQHASSASMNVKLPGDDNWPGETGVVIFSNCTVAAGKTVAQALAVHDAWAEHLTATGSQAGVWIWFSGFGAGDVDYDYKIVVGHADHNSVGADWENFTNGRGWMKAVEINAGVVSCDSPRVYNSATVRNGNVRPN